MIAATPGSQTLRYADSMTPDSGVLIQNLGSKASGAKDITTTINAVNNVGNANGQATAGRGSRSNQNSTQTFISQ